MYNAIAGSCAEDEANAGGGGVTPPAGITAPSQIYTSIFNGGPVGFTVQALGFNFQQFFLNNAPSQVIPALGGNQTTNTNMSITNLTSPAINNGQFTIQITETISASTLNALFGAGYTTGGGVLVPIDELFFLFGWYLECPNSVVMLFQTGDISITGASANFTGIGLAAKTTRSEVGQSYPLVDSTSFNNAHLALPSFAPTPSDAHLGSNGVVTAGNNTQFIPGDSHCIVSLRNFASRLGGTPSATAGQSMNIAFSIQSQVVIGSPPATLETTHILYTLLLN